MKKYEVTHFFQKAGTWDRGKKQYFLGKRVNVDTPGMVDDIRQGMSDCVNAADGVRQC